MFADEYLNGVIYSSIGNVLVMISAFTGRERWWEILHRGKLRNRNWKKSSAAFKLKYHLNINVRFLFTVVLPCHPGFSTKCDSLHHWYTPLSWGITWREASLYSDWSQFYSVPVPPCDTEENVQVGWLPREINQPKKNPNKKNPTPQSIKEKEEIKNVNPEILSCILMLEPEHCESWLSLYYIVSKMEI